MSSAVLPVTLVLTASYLVAITVVAADPEGVWGVLASIFPFTAPIAMPIRWAGGQVPVAQLLLAMALTAAAAVLLVWLASAIYRRALVITGRRVRVSEVLRHADRPVLTRGLKAPQGWSTARAELEPRGCASGAGCTPGIRASARAT